MAKKNPVLEAVDLNLSWDSSAGDKRAKDAHAKNQHVWGMRLRGALAKDVHRQISAEKAMLVVRKVNMHVSKGELVCLVGRSGTGKTTILHALAGLMRPLSGQVLLHGRDIAGCPGQVSYMFQQDLLLPHKTVLDNCCLPLIIKGVSKLEARKQAEQLFERFGLSGCEHKWPSQLSGGMRQRAAFLRTYLMGNDCVLLDEPFSALDALTRTDLRSWYRTMARELGLATVAITHDVDEAIEMADRVYVLGFDAKERDGAAGATTSAAAISGEANLGEATSGEVISGEATSTETITASVTTAAPASGAATIIGEVILRTSEGQHDSSRLSISEREAFRLKILALLT